MSAGCSTRRATAPMGYEAYASQMGESFADNRGMLEDVLAALFRSRAPTSRSPSASRQFLRRRARGFRPGRRRRGSAPAAAAPRAPGRPDRGGPLRDARPEAQRHRRGGARGLAAADAREPPGQPGRPRRAARSSSPAPARRWRASTPPGTRSSGSAGCDTKCNRITTITTDCLNKKVSKQSASTSGGSGAAPPTPPGIRSATMPMPLTMSTAGASEIRQTAGRPLSAATRRQRKVRAPREYGAGQPPAGATPGTVPQKTNRPRKDAQGYPAGKGETVRQERTAPLATGAAG